MSLRHATAAGMFYPGMEAPCRSEVEDLVARARARGLGLLPDPVGGIVPHAGWAFSGATAALVFHSLSACESIHTFLLFGAVHRPIAAAHAAVSGEEAWETPLGKAAVDDELAQALVDASEGFVERVPAAHQGEHSIEVQLPLIQTLFPDARICPVAVRPSTGATAVGRAAAEAARSLSRDVAAVGSTDLTHYGGRYGFQPKGAGEEAHRWMKEQNDSAFLDRLLAFDGPGALEHASRNSSACGAGAAVAALACARALGAEKAALLEHTTSHEIMPERTAENFVGYAGILFSRG